MAQMRILASAGSGWLRSAGSKQRKFVESAIYWRGFKVAIVGRPNVGKSSLFNRLVGGEKALVYDKPGVTRDCIHGEAQFGGITFQVTDTAGLDDGLDMQGEDQNVHKVGPHIAASGIGRWPTHLLTEALEHTTRVVQDSDLVAFLVDARAGITPLDIQFARWINKQARPALLIANKSEGNVSELEPGDVRKMGLGEPLYISVVSNMGFGPLVAQLLPLEEISRGRLARAARTFVAAREQSGALVTRPVPVTDAENDVAEQEPGAEDEGTVVPPRSDCRVIVLGRPNVGKSTLVNALYTGGDPRITRDPVTVNVAFKDKALDLTDSAGLRRKLKQFKSADPIDIAVSETTLKRVRTADVAVLLLDASDVHELVTMQDLTIAAAVHKEGKGLVVGVNKADLLTPKERRQLEESAPNHMANKFPDFGQVTAVFLSAAENRGVTQLMDEVLKAHAIWRASQTTQEVMRLLTDVKRIGKMTSAQHPNLKFARQVDAGPPFFVFTCTRAAKATDGYLNFLTNNLRSRFGLHGTPVSVTLRDSNTGETAGADLLKKRTEQKQKDAATGATQTRKYLQRREKEPWKRSRRGPRTR